MKKRRYFQVGAIALATASAALNPLYPVSADPRPIFHPVIHRVSDSDSTYFVMTDRFANGDSSNDLGGLSDFRLTSGFDPSDPGFYHGGDLQGLTSKLQYIKELGFTSIWITPPVAQKTVQGSSAAYHGYWGLDFTTIDKHLGSEADFRNLITSAHSLGIKVIVDIVVNHTADVIQYDTSKHAYIPKGQQKIKKPDFLNVLSDYHNMGDSTFTGPSLLTGDFFGLDDLYTEKPAVRTGWVDLWSQWITKYKFDGFRIDTARHVEPGFWQTFLPAVIKAAKSAGIANFVTYGEIADSNPENVAPFTTEQNFQSALDFPFQSALTRYVSSPGGAAGLADLFNADDLYTTATSNANSLRTFLGNHDMGRIGYFLEKSASWDGEDVLLRRDILAQSLLLLLRGSPVIYYGDEKGMTGTGGDKAARQDMFATQVADWQSEARIGQSPIGLSSSFDIPNPLESAIKGIQALRILHPDLISGAQQLRIATGDLFAVTRSGGKSEYLITANSGESEKSFSIPVTSRSSQWSVLAGSGTVVSNNASGLVTVTIPAQSFILAQSSDLLTPSSTPTIKMLPVESDQNSQGWAPVTATVAGSDYNQVDFMVRRVSGGWIDLGTADHRTIATGQTRGGLYRVYLHPSQFKAGSKLTVVAIARDFFGHQITSAPMSYVVGR